MRILIVKLSALGDVIHTLPSLTTLRRHRPDAEISWLVEDTAAGLIEGHPALDRVRVVPRREWSRLAREGRRWAAARDFLARVREHRRDRYDLVIDFQGLAKSGLWVALARAREKAGFGRGLPRNEGAWMALNRRIPPGPVERHALDRSLDLLEALGYPRLPLAYDLPEDPVAGAEADRLLAGLGIGPGTTFVAVNPMTRWPTKNWEAGRFATVLLGLRAAGVSFVMTGGAGDRGDLDAIEAAWGHGAGSLPRLDGRTSLAVLTAVYRRARVVLSTDTGPMHLAAAVGTPVVALFGPTSPRRTGPFGPEHTVLQLPLECSPCFRRRCETTRYESRACMLRLGPEAVLAAVLDKVRLPRVGGPG